MTTRRINNDKNMTEEQQKEQIDQQKDNYYNNNNHTDPGVFRPSLPPAEVMQRIAEAYKANINPMITAVAAQVIEDALTHGMEPATVILAIEETGMANRPSPYYLRAVLRHWAEFGVVFSRRRGEMIGTTDARPWWK